MQKKLLLNSRASATSQGRKLAPIDSEQLKNRDLVGMISPERIVREPFAEADLKFENCRHYSKPKTSKESFSKESLLPPTLAKSKTRT